MNAEDEDFLEIYQPSATEQKLVSILVLPSSILSLIGSSMIIRCIRRDKKSSPYRRLMLALSICDVVGTIGYVLQPFLGPTGIEFSYVWGFGNDATCSFMGALLQFSFSAHWYAGALSFYFLSTVRFGTREDVFAKKYERWIHIVIVLFGMSTAIAGVVMDVFHARRISPGCWVSHPDPCYGMNCHAELIAWGFAGLPTLFMLLLVITNNLILYCHVRGVIIEGQKRALQLERSMAMYHSQNSRNSGDIGGSSLGNGLLGSERSSMSKSVRTMDNKNKDTRRNKGSILRSSSKQWKRVKDVGTQSFLYVGAYLTTFIWAAGVNVLNGRDFEKKNSAADVAKVYFPLLILQSIFTPAQGFLNAFVFFRPKYNQCRAKYVRQSRIWAMKRAIFGDSIKERPETETSGCEQAPPLSPIVVKRTLSFRKSSTSPHWMPSTRANNSLSANSFMLAWRMTTLLHLNCYCTCATQDGYNANIVL